MPRRKKSSKMKTLAILIIIIGAALGVVAWHDGLIGATTVSSINDGDVSAGTQVVVRGIYKTTFLGAIVIHGADGSGTLMFEWTGAIPAVDTLVVVRGKVMNTLFLEDVTSMDAVWLFK